MIDPGFVPRLEGAMTNTVGIQQTRAVLAVAAGAAIIGFAPIGMRLSELGPMATGFWRFAFALPGLAILAAMAPVDRRPKKVGPLLAAGVCFGLDLTLWHAALVLTTVLNATLLSNMTPILAAAAGWLFLRERVSWSFAMGAGVALAGAGLLSAARASASGGALQGDLLALASAVWYAAYLVILREARRGVDVRVAMFVTTIASLAVAAAATFALGEAWLPKTAHGWLVLIGLGLLVHTLGQGLIAYGVGQLPIALSTVVLWVQPVAAAALSWVLFGEALGPLALAGAVLVLGGVWIVQRGRA
ncbi:MAG: DMT family transporter [Alphaproteobacteria bacterium]|nr:DMT family transporter [Alphaproteobacteria bacterium]